MVIWESILNDHPIPVDESIDEDITCCPGVGCCMWIAIQTNEDGEKTRKVGGRCCGAAAIVSGKCCPKGVSREDIFGMVGPVDTGGGERPVPGDIGKDLG